MPERFEPGWLAAVGQGADVVKTAAVGVISKDLLVQLGSAGQKVKVLTRGSVGPMFRDLLV